MWGGGGGGGGGGGKRCVLLGFLGNLHSNEKPQGFRIRGTKISHLEDTIKTHPGLCTAETSVS